MCIWIYIYIYIYICTYICVCICICIHVYMYVCMYVYVYIYVCMHVCMCMCTFIYVYVYVYIRDHMHFCRESACIYRCCWTPCMSRCVREIDVVNISVHICFTLATGCAYALYIYAIYICAYALYIYKDERVPNEITTLFLQEW